MNATQPQPTSQFAAAQPLVTPAGAGTVYDFPAFGHRILSKVSTRDTGGAFAVGEVVAEKKGGVPPHIHSREEETFYVLDGRFEFQIGDETIEAGVGDTVFAPRLVTHAFRCVSEDGGRALILATPGEFENFLAELAQIPPSPEAEAQAAALFDRYGLGFVAPGHRTEPNSAPFAPLVVPAGQGQFFDLGDHRGWGKVGSPHNGGAFLLAETHVDPNGGVPPHIHRREEETFYILEGRFALQVGDQTIKAGPGDTVFAPRDLMHTWRCVGETPGRFLLLITPGANFEAFAGEMPQRNLVPARDMADPTLAAQFMALTEQYGIEMLPPVK